MSYDQMNDRPPRELHSWGVCYKGEPRKGACTVIVNACIPFEVLRQDGMFDYIEQNLGWKVHRHAGWSCGSTLESPDGLTMVGVTVRAREIRAALKGA